MNNSPKENIRASLLVHTVRLAKARKAHDEAKSDTTRNVATGQTLYQAEQDFERVTRGWLDSSASVLDEIVTDAVSPMNQAAIAAIAVMEAHRKK